MNQTDTITIFKQNSYGEYREEKLIEDVKKAISPFAGIDRKGIRKNLQKIKIPTTLHIQQISHKGLVNDLSKIGASLEVTPLDHEVFVVCNRPKTFPGYVYGVVYFLYGIFSFLCWRWYIKPGIQTFSS